MLVFHACATAAWLNTSTTVTGAQRANQQHGSCQSVMLVWRCPDHTSCLLRVAVDLYAAGAAEGAVPRLCACIPAAGGVWRPTESSRAPAPLQVRDQHLPSCMQAPDTSVFVSTKPAAQEQSSDSTKVFASTDLQFKNSLPRIMLSHRCHPAK
jgi:hypothetical protein